MGTDTELFWGKQEDRPIEPGVDLEGNARKSEDIVAAALDPAGAESPKPFHDPHLMIEAGNVASIVGVRGLADCVPAGKALVRHVEAIQAGATGVNVAFGANVNEHLVEGVFLVKVEDARWGIKGASLVISECGE